jgi:hypothetical protein
MENNLYTYHKERIKVIGFIPLPRLNYYMNKYNRNKRIYFSTLWLNSVCYLFDYLSNSSIYMMVKSMGLMELDDQYILDSIKDYNKDKPHYMIFTHFEWNKEELYKTFCNRKEVNKYKQSIRNKYNASKVHQDKTDLLLNLIENNKSIYYSEVILSLKKKISKNTIKKVLIENDIKLEKKSKSFILIEDKLNDLFKYRIDAVKTKLTIVILSKYTGVGFNTLKRFLIANPEYKIKVDNFNKTINQ